REREGKRKKEKCEIREESRRLEKMQLFSFNSEVSDPLTNSTIYRGLGALLDDSSSFSLSGKNSTSESDLQVGYSPRAEEAQSGAPTGKRSHKERLSTVETRLDVLEASLEELYQGQGRLLGVESSQEEAESRIDRVESLVD
ncbi:hypothetical protein BHE74_00001253, partial [Ensete ventricosum]